VIREHGRDGLSLFMGVITNHESLITNHDSRRTQTKEIFMKIVTSRGAPFVDREEEIEFFVDWFNEVSRRIFWVYGPKSSGKTTAFSMLRVEVMKVRNKSQPSPILPL